MIICKQCGTKNRDKARHCKQCKGMLARAEEKRPIPNTVISRSQTGDEERSIPSTVVTKNKKPNIPKTFVNKKSSDPEERPIPKTVISNARSIPSTVLGKESKIPQTIVTNKDSASSKNQVPDVDIEPPDFDLFPPSQGAKEELSPPQQNDNPKGKDLFTPSAKNDIFEEYSNIVSPIFTDPKGLKQQKKTGRTESVEEIVVCPYCRTENVGYNKKCQVCDNLLPNSPIEQQLTLEPVQEAQENSKWARLDSLVGEKSYPLSQMEIIIGRDQGDITFPEGKFLSSSHTKLYYYQQQLAVLDLKSLNGTYVRLRKPYLLNDQDSFAIGQQIFQFKKISPALPAPPKRKTQAFSSVGIVPQGKLIYTLDGNPYEMALLQNSTVIGLEQGNLTFPHDKGLSNPHIQITLTQKGYVLQDLQSRTGTWIQIKRPSLLKHGDMLRIGEYSFAVHFPSGEVK